MKRRLLSLLLACVMLFSLLCPAFAEDENAGTDEITTEESGGTDNDLPGESGGDEPGENKASDDETPEDPMPTEEETPSVPAAEPEHVHTPLTVDEIPATEDKPGVTAGVVCAECGEILEGCETIPALKGEELPAELGAEPPEIVYAEGHVTLPAANADGSDADALLQGYFDRLVQGGGGRRRGSTAGDRLSGAEAQAYSFLSEKIALVASGRLASTEFTISVASLGLSKASWTISELGLEDDPIFDENGYLTEAANEALYLALDSVFSYGNVLNALLADHPYELFWFDKVYGAPMWYGISYDGESLGINIQGDLDFMFYVAEEYAADDFTVNTSLIQSIQAAAANAQSIVTACASYSDRTKLQSYVTEICTRVSYNYDALGDIPYGNPWQLIWVFDDDSSTNVVCEGYSKAFQYLCDLSSFQSGSVRCLSVSGMMSGGTGAGAHMWNVVRLDDGFNYLVDVTNCDSGAIGYPDKLFLAVPSRGTVESGYVFTASGCDISYTYGDDMFSIFSAEDLTIGIPPRTVTASGVCGAQGDNLTWTLYSDGELVIEGDGEMADYTSSSAPAWAEEREQILRVTFRESVTSIGSEAFARCANLTAVQFPSTLTSIGNAAFSRCYALTRAEIPAGVTSIGLNAFYFCEALESVTIPVGVTAIRQASFAFCGSLPSVTIPEGVTSIEFGAFQSCGTLESISIPASVTRIDESVFYSCASLTSVVYSGTQAQRTQYESGWNTEGNDALFNASWTYLTALASGSCGAQGDNLTWTLYDNGELAIKGEGDMAMFGVPGYEADESLFAPWYGYRGMIISISLPAGLTGISQGAFYGCSAISEVTIPASVRSIGYMAFYWCSALTDIYVENGNSAFCSNDGVLFAADGSSLLAYPIARSASSYSVPEGTATIGFQAFSFADKLTSVTLPAGLQMLDGAAFSNCTGLTEIVLPSSVTTLWDSVFFYCSNLRSVTFSGDLPELTGASFEGASFTAYYPAGNETWTEDALAQYGGNNIVWVSYTPEDTRTIVASGSCGAEGDNVTWTLYEDGELVIEGSGDMAEDYRNGAPWDTYQDQICSLTVCEGVTSLGVFAFSDCIQLSEVSLPNSLRRIKWGAFYHTGISEIRLPEGLQAVDSSAFADTNLTEITFPASVTELDRNGSGDGMFIGTPIQNIYVAEGSRSFRSEDGVLFSKDGKTLALFPAGRSGSYTVPAGVETIGYKAFDGNHLSSLTLPEGVVSIESGAFHFGRTPLTLFLPASLSRIENAFSACDIQEIVLAEGSEYFCIAGGALYTKDLSRIVVIFDNDSDVFVVAEGVESIGSGVFSYEMNFREIVLPASLTSIDPYELNNLQNLTTITVSEQNEHFYSLDGVLFSKDGSRLIYCYSLQGDAYNVPAGVTEIAGHAFRSRYTLTEVTLPEGLTTIGECAFQWCSRLEEINIPSSLRSIGYYAFYGCNALSRVSFSGSQKQWNAIEIGRNNEPLLNAEISYLPAPVITQQPESVAAHVDDPVTFTVAATDAQSYQWSYQKPGESTWTNVSSGGSSASYTLPAAALRHNGYKYRCTVTNASGSVTSAAATLTVTEILRITTQPSDVRVKEGASASFKVVATGVKSYQWEYQKPGEEVWTAVSAASGKTASYSMTVKASHNGNKYRCKLTGGDGVLYTDEATLRLLPKPTITQQPESISVFSGEVAVFTVAAEDATGYQWSYQKPGTSTWTNVSTNGTSESYTLTTASRHNGYKYRCTVKNAAGSTVSAAAKLTVRVPIVITAQPSDTRVKEGAKANFKVVATGVKSYQWEYQKPGETSWSAVSSSAGKTASYSFTTAARHNGYKYRCELKNATESVITEAVELTLNLKPIITQQPESLNVFSGDAAVFTVAAEGAESYQWSYQKPGTSTWTNVSTGGNSASYTLASAATRHNGYKYRCTVKNAVGSTVSATATLKVGTRIVITTPPTDKHVSAGKSVSFKVTATGATSYQWQYQKPGETTWTAVSAASGKTASYSFTAAERHDGYQYRCLLKNAATSVYTDPVTLTVG